MVRETGLAVESLRSSAHPQRAPADNRLLRYRLFIAIELPEKVKQAIEKAQEELRAAVPAKSIRWTRREQFHLTMRFLGSVEALQVDRLNEALRRGRQATSA